MNRLFSICASILFITGCVNPEINYTESTNTTAAVVIVIGDSYIGKNPGAEADVRMMTEILTNLTDDIVIMKNGDATKKNVREAITRACRKELAIVFFSCHGGQESTFWSKDTEADGKDEYVFLSDSSITDNELWECFTTSSNRVFTIFNCCNAGTMFKQQTPGSLFGAKRTDDIRLNPDFALLSWSASADGKIAWSDSDGGKFVKAIYGCYSEFPKEFTYDDIWTATVYSTGLRDFQCPQKSLIGKQDAFNGKPAFR